MHLAGAKLNPQATEEQQNAMRAQAGAIAELRRDLEGTTDIMNRLKLLLADRNQTLDGEMAEIQVGLFLSEVGDLDACV